jgi:hypothetical protein
MGKISICPASSAHFHQLAVAYARTRELDKYLTSLRLRNFNIGQDAERRSAFE